MIGPDDRREVEALEAELRADRLEDPGEAFFADLEQRILRDLPPRPAPSVPWWYPGTVWRRIWRPAPRAALAGAAAVALVVLWVGGPGGPPQDSMILLPETRLVARDPAPRAARRTPAPRVTPGEAWFAQLPPTEDLWALEDEALPALLALVSAEDPTEEDEPQVTPLGDFMDEQAINGLTEEQLRGLERELDKQRPRQQIRPVRPRPSKG